MSILFIWNDDYSVGDETLDRQHQNLFDLGNKIQKADKSEARKYVMSLYKYIRTHFDREENHMKSMGFPWVDEHRLKHEELIENLNRLSKDFDPDNLKELAAFLHEWLVTHVLVEDKKYFTFTRSALDHDDP